MLYNAETIENLARKLERLRILNDLESAGRWKSIRNLQRNMNYYATKIRNNGRKNTFYEMVRLIRPFMKGIFRRMFLIHIL